MRRLLRLMLFLLVPLAAWAHVGSKDVFETVHAGPYILNVTVRPPNVIPGVATVEIRSTGAEVASLSIVPLPLTGEAARHPPAADVMERSATDRAFFTGTVWIMASGTWQVRVSADGAGGAAQASVPVVAVPVATLHMGPGLGWLLALLGAFLAISMAALVAAAVRESRLRPGVLPTPQLQRKGTVALGVCLVVILACVLLANRWWNVEAADYAENVYHAQPLGAVLTGDQLELRPQLPPVKAVYGRSPAEERRIRAEGARFLLDHGKVMHLYAIREPEMDAAFHLHPALDSSGAFRVALPAMPAGHYRLYGDVVHGNGFPETLQAQIDVPEGMAGVPLDAEDAAAAPAPLSAGELGTRYKLPDGYSMQWDRPAELRSATAYDLHFTLLDPQGRPAQNMEPYLGMAGHAAFVKTDGSVFAHTHPDGSAAMLDVMLADQTLPGGAGMEAMHEDAPISPQVSFPYGFPSAGRYRIFIQMKHGGTVETGVFDAEVR